MAYIKRGTRDSLKFVERNSNRFDCPYVPGQEIDYAGIYRCQCGVEALLPEVIQIGKTKKKDKKFPPYDPPHHVCACGEIEWYLLVSIDNVPNTIPKY